MKDKLHSLQGFKPFFNFFVASEITYVNTVIKNLDEHPNIHNGSEIKFSSILYLRVVLLLRTYIIINLKSISSRNIFIRNVEIIILAHFQLSIGNILKVLNKY